MATAALMGFDSSIATVSNMFPELVHSIVKAVKNSNFTKAYTLQKKLNKLVDVISCQGNCQRYFLNSRIC